MFLFLVSETGVLNPVDFKKWRPRWGGSWWIGLALFVLAGGGMPVSHPVQAQVRPAETLASPNAEPRGAFGHAGARIGDVNGDGSADFVVGAPGETVQDSSSAGRVYLFSGASGDLLRRLESPTPREDAEFGEAVAGIGDVNGDGVPDVLVGVSNARVDGTPLAGRVHLISGADGRRLRTLTSPNMEENGAFGDAVAGIADLNGDGGPEVVVGAPVESVNGLHQAGRVYIISGTDGRLIRRLQAPTPKKEASFGRAVSPAGDVDGDGTPDVIVGAQTETVQDSSRAGRAYVVSGTDGTVVKALQSPNVDAGGHFGGAVAGVGDVSGDGRPDVMIGGDREGTTTGSRGRAYLFSGKKGTLKQTIGPGASRISGSNASSEGLGSSIARGRNAAGGEGPDVFLGADRAMVGDKEEAGKVFLIDGETGTPRQTLKSPNAEGYKPGMMAGNEGSRFGRFVANIGDVNGDGRPDVLIGADGENVDGHDAAGRAYVFTSSTEN